MSNVENFPTGNYGTEFHGPFIQQWKVTSGGYRVPYLAAQVNNGHVSLSLDERFIIDAPQTEVEKWIPFIANCMAVAAGYSCHGKNCTPKNEFTVLMSQIGEKP